MTPTGTRHACEVSVLPIALSCLFSSSAARTKGAKRLGTGPAPSDCIRDHHAVKATVSSPDGPRYGRPSFHFGPPTALSNKSLAILKHDLEHPENFTPTEEHMVPALQLVATATAFFEEENQRGNELEKILPAFLGQGVKWRTPIAGGSAKPNGILLEGSFACLIFELKNEPGLEGDPFLQSLVVYDKIINHEVSFRSPPLHGPAVKLPLQYSGFITQSNFPVVLLTMAGNYLVVSTAVYTDAVYADKLLSIDLHLGSHGPANVLRLARVFMAIRNCTDTLSGYYRRLKPGPQPSVMYPSPTADPPEDQTKIPQLEYIAKMDRASGIPLSIVDEDNECHGIYLAKRTCSSTDDSSAEVVLVKFTSTYGQSAHRLLAEQDPPLAPALYSCNRVIGGLYMVVMEYLPDASPLHRFFPPSPVPYSLKAEVIREALKKALELLHARDHVFGDLREPNVLYSHEGDRVFLVDFDWVGKHQESRYSPCLNPGANLGVKAWQVMEKVHDEANLQRLMTWLTGE